MQQVNLILTTSEELHSLIQDAMNVVVNQISLPQKTDPLPEYLSIQQASLFLNLAKPTLYTLVRQRRVPFIKKTKKLYFLKSDLQNWLEKGKTKS